MRCIAEFHLYNINQFLRWRNFTKVARVLNNRILRFYFLKMSSHKTVIIDEIMSQLDAAKSGVVPGSVCQAVVSGIQNVPSQITQSRMMSTGSSSAYTTFPLSPIVKNCCLDKSYLNMEFDINFMLHVVGTASKTFKIPFYFGLRDNASMFNQLQILIENSAIWTTTYQREESVLSYNSLPETEIRGNNQYASIQKMMDAEYSPMKRLVIEATTEAGGSVDVPVGVHFKTTIDINRLTPLLSNLHYTTPHFGNMRLKVFLQDFAKCLFFCPDYNYIANYYDAGTPANSPIFQLIGSQFCNQYWSFYPLSEFAGRTIAAAQIPFYGWNDTDHKMEILTSIAFNDPEANTDFMTFAQNGTAEIVQTCFDIKEEEYQRLTDYFASIGSIIIPSQTWSSSVFNNSGVVGGQNWPESQIGNVGGYNIDFISVWQHPEGSPCCFNKEFLNNIQLILDGRPVNSLPYAYINDKCITDTTQAIIDTDHEEINKDYIHSLAFLNMNDTQTYLNNAASVEFGGGQVGNSIRRKNLINPNTFCLNFSTNLPDAFHSGACVLENSNRQAVIRFNSTNQQAATPFTTGRNAFPFYITASNAANVNSQSTTTGFSTFCDCCIVLTYDPARATCYDGQLSWAAPYI